MFKRNILFISLFYVLLSNSVCVCVYGKAIAYVLVADPCSKWLKLGKFFIYGRICQQKAIQGFPI